MRAVEVVLVSLGAVAAINLLTALICIAGETVREYIDTGGDDAG